MAPNQPSTGLFVGLNKGDVVTKRRLGTHERAKKKREEMSSVLRKMRLAGCVLVLMFYLIFLSTIP